MTKITKILLAISLSGFALGSTGLLWGFGMPVGAIFFGWFMVFKLLEKEMALFDEEQRRNAALAERYHRSVIDSVGGPIPGPAKAARLIPARAR